MPLHWFTPSTAITGASICKCFRQVNRSGSCFLTRHTFTVCRPFCIPKLACFAAWNGLRMEQGNLLRRYLLQQKPERERIVATYHIADDDESAMGSARRFYHGKHEETA